MAHKITIKLLELAQELDKTDKHIECSMIVNDMENLIDGYVTKQSGIQFNELLTFIAEVASDDRLMSSARIRERAAELLKKHLGIRPKPPLCRVMRQGVGHFCKNCGSTMPRSGFLMLIGKRYCDNSKCLNSKSETK
jgi:hypothetical protein